MRVPFGKHRGLEVSEVPTSYLTWLQQVACPPLLDEVRDELRRRSFGDCMLPPAPRPRRAAELIELGWRAAARRHHPDIGGTDENMVEVIEARDWLRQLVGA